MNDKVESKLEKKLREIQAINARDCAFAISEMMEAQAMGQKGMDTATLMRAAYHAGVYRAIQKALF